MSLWRTSAFAAPSRDLLRHGYDVPATRRRGRSDGNAITSERCHKGDRPCRRAPISSMSIMRYWAPRLLPNYGDTMTDATPRSLSLLERLDKGPVICAEG